jgi:hypothetical protein
MKCPHRIEPHQIQGLDFIHIFPVIQVSIRLYLISGLLVQLRDYVELYVAMWSEDSSVSDDPAGSVVRPETLVPILLP